MSDQPTLQRMLEILTLLSGNIMYSVSEIAQKKNISERTVYRYIETFENAGFVFTKEHKRMKIDRQNSQDKQLCDLLHFSEEEAYILSKAIHSVDENNLIKSNLIKKLYSLYDFDRVANTIVKKEQSENIHQLIQAIKNRKQVILKEYQSANSNCIADRLVEPIDFTINYIAVWCYEPGTGETKLFKTTRIKKIEFCETDCCNQAAYKVGYIDAFRICSQKKIPVKLQLTLRAKNLLIEEYPLAESHIVETGNKYYFDGWVCGWEGVARFVMGLPGETKVIVPDELKIFIIEKQKKVSVDGM